MDLALASSFRMKTRAGLEDKEKQDDEANRVLDPAPGQTSTEAPRFPHAPVAPSSGPDNPINGPCLF